MRKMLGVLVFCLTAGTAHALDLTSPDVKGNEKMPKAQEYNSFGCSGDNLSPALAWKNSPAGTQSFAITIYDPDAPSGSGWWHWIVYDIPATVSALPNGIGIKSTLPVEALQGRNDYGSHSFGGACPPVGDKPHRYVFTVYALKTPKLDVPQDASAALIGFMLNTTSLGSGSFISFYSR